MRLVLPENRGLNLLLHTLRIKSRWTVRENAVVGWLYAANANVKFVFRCTPCTEQLEQVSKKLNKSLPRESWKTPVFETRLQMPPHRRCKATASLFFTRSCAPLTISRQRYWKEAVIYFSRAISVFSFVRSCKNILRFV